MLKLSKKNPGAAPGLEHDEIELLPSEPGQVQLSRIVWLSMTSASSLLG